MKKDTRSFYEIAVTAAVQRIAASLDDALDLGSLARGAALSPLHFHHVFRGMLGETPLEMHRRLRLERASHRLVTGATPITAIAFEAGYETHESFTRAFRQAFAASPSEVRERAKESRASCVPLPPSKLVSTSGIHFAEESAEGSAEGRAEPIRIHSLRGGQVMNVEIENMPEMIAAAVSHVGPYNTISEAFARLGEIAGRAGLFALPGAQMIAVYHDDPESTPAAELRSDAGIVVPKGTKLPPELHAIPIAKGEYAKTTHIGPYSLLGDAWARLLGEWIPASGRRVADGVSYELYRNNPMNAAPADLRTDIYVPLAEPAR